MVISFGVDGFTVLNQNAKADLIEIDLEAISKMPPACTRCGGRGAGIFTKVGVRLGNWDR